MWAIRIVAVACFIAVSVQADTSLEQLIQSLTFSEAHLQDAFDGLDVVEPKGKITDADLSALLYHGEAAFAKKKFIAMVDGPDADKDVDLEELTKFVKTRAVTLAVYECVYIHSESIRETCFGDQILTYVYLVIDKDNAEKFFDYLEDDNDKDDVIEAKEIQAKVGDFPGFDDKDIDNLLLEIGGPDKKITKVEFVEYIMQEDISDDFRECRTSIVDCVVTYDFKCMTIELFDYTKNEMTERDIGILFDKLDTNDDLVITKDELTSIWSGINQVMDLDKNGKVCYGEFRTYVTQHTVQIQLEHFCTEKFAGQIEELNCLEDLLVKLVQQNHHGILMAITDLDMLFTFEELDKDDNGKLHLKEDLVSNGWDEATATKLVKYMDYKDKDGMIDLEEWFSYTKEPHVVYGIGDCLIEPKSVDQRLNCFITELKDVITDMLEEEQVDALFAFYDKDSNHLIDEKDLNNLGIPFENDDLPNFLWELGMGDQTVSKYELRWFVRQQRLTVMFKTASDKSPESLHPITVRRCFVESVYILKMPSIEESCVRSPSDSSTTQDFLARDMEELVCEMKENLRLSGFKSKQTHRTSRPSPYQIPSRWGDSNCKTCVLSSGVKSCSVHSRYNKNSKSADTDDPYELLQDLIRDGSLIKEAVRRLQKGLWPEQRYIYDSDEESTRSPMKLCQQ